MVKFGGMIFLILIFFDAAVAHSGNTPDFRQNFPCSNLTRAERNVYTLSLGTGVVSQWLCTRATVVSGCPPGTLNATKALFYVKCCVCCIC